MTAKRSTPQHIDEYIAGFPNEVQEMLSEIRRTIKNAVPRAVETISYQIPAFKLDGKPIVYFAAYRKHIAIYPAPRGSEAFREELSSYAGGKGTIQFPLDLPIPYDLIRRIAEFRARGIIAESEASS